MNKSSINVMVGYDGDVDTKITIERHAFEYLGVKLQEMTLFLQYSFPNNDMAQDFLKTLKKTDGFDARV